MIYVDTSVVLAYLLAEDRLPEEAFWDEALISSRLLEYEVWVRLHARRLAKSHGDIARALLARIDLVEMTPLILRRAIEPFPIGVRTLDAIHFATMHFLRGQGQRPRLASYDQRLSTAARRLRFNLLSL